MAKDLCTVQCPGGRDVGGSWVETEIDARLTAVSKSVPYTATSLLAHATVHGPASLPLLWFAAPTLDTPNTAWLPAVLDASTLLLTKPEVARNRYRLHFARLSKDNKRFGYSDANVEISRDQKNYKGEDSEEVSPLSRLIYLKIFLALIPIAWNTWLTSSPRVGLLLKERKGRGLVARMPHSSHVHIYLSTSLCGAASALFDGHLNIEGGEADEIRRRYVASDDMFPPNPWISTPYIYVNSKARFHIAHSPPSQANSEVAQNQRIVLLTIALHRNLRAVFFDATTLQLCTVTISLVVAHGGRDLHLGYPVLPRFAASEARSQNRGRGNVRWSAIDTIAHLLHSALRLGPASLPFFAFIDQLGKYMLGAEPLIPLRSISLTLHTKSFSTTLHCPILPIHTFLSTPFSAVAVPSPRNTLSLCTPSIAASPPADSPGYVNGYAGLLHLHLLSSFFAGWEGEVSRAGGGDNKYPREAGGGRVAGSPLELVWAEDARGVKGFQVVYPAISIPIITVVKPGSCLALLHAFCGKRRLVYTPKPLASSTSAATFPAPPERNILASDTGSPRYAGTYRNRVDLGVGVHPSTSSPSSSYFYATWSAPTTCGFGSGGANYSTYNLSTPSTMGELESLGFGTGERGAGVIAEWGEGFETKLKFDLMENARALSASLTGPEEIIEESFLDVFCDLLWGGGWMERAAGVGGPTAELTNEFGGVQLSPSGAVQDSETTVVLFAEFVLRREYRLALAGTALPGPRRQLPALFQSGSTPVLSGKTWKQVATLSGRPYVVCATPAVTGSTRELDFESMIRGGGGTKVLPPDRDQDRRSTGPMSP
ncbi:hypothetical protein R3P38DRAFT_3574488 [Favolaschia claudopus]|uniref:Uncharacterized protein n=1 Tax=Favolaschia claudopus TaxID=2862362 RepID=A0AAW0AMJ9_9AGAR